MSIATLAIYRALGRHIYVEYDPLDVILGTSLDAHRHVSYKECKHLDIYMAMTNVNIKLLKRVISLHIDIPNTLDCNTAATNVNIKLLRSVVSLNIRIPNTLEYDTAVHRHISYLPGNGQIYLCRI